MGVEVRGDPLRLTLRSAASSASNKEQLDVKPETEVLEGLGVLCINEIMVRMISYYTRARAGTPFSVVCVYTHAWNFPLFYLLLALNAQTDALFHMM